MKTIGKMLLDKVITVILVITTLAIGFLWFKNGIFGLFDGVTKEQYSFVIKRFEKESKKAIYKTSEHVLNDEERQEKVAKFAGESLENLINLGAEKELDIQIEVKDLVFENVDK